ncbi:hypothetical protein AGABI1DRAFT_111276 [Agaricus bisporus var. burnettii JB137-S8]|uniref:Glutamine synthetase n=2 Tax=Agaricus bisporus var. burnettii TaxID=192524 RepID=K5Y3Y3_AGABU|nr:uncharacterized protein AGABI1DRAFT_111276 [Agaricus bisporus var. burnettii JB137-S8]EKM82695.1 hypothetical protein AGABI1DRAFT_111276 [Agaricus bisporus var. burnettii JB137-S8]KAF7778737.1 hypothetical protein Agabi119p4_3082 [Agaricus bisporus var. burnettii]
MSVIPIYADLGILHTPASIAAAFTTLTIQDLKNAGIKYIHIQWVEPSNIIRLRMVPISHFEKMLQSARPGIGIPKVTGGFVYLVTAEGYGAAGEYLYVPDMSSLRLCPYAPGTASIFGWLEEKDAYKGPDGQMTAKTLVCPRAKVRDLVAEAQKDGVEFLIGFESEFNLLTSINPVRAGSHHQYGGARGLLVGLPETKALQEIVDALIDSGIKVEACHPEAGPGQYEIVTGPLSPLAAADVLVHTRQTIVNIASKHGLHATFAPRISMTAPGSAAHMHISAHRVGEKKPKETLSSLEKSFLAGVIDDIRALSAITLPIPASYKRVGDGVFSGGTYVAWGTENRECPIRLSNATSPSSRNFEMRFIDGTANPYLVVASFIGLGYAGIKSKRELHLQNFSSASGPALLSEEERQARGITQRMPLTWEESREHLTKSKALREVLGSEFVDKYLSVNKTLAGALGIHDGDEEKSLTHLVELY